MQELNFRSQKALKFTEDSQRTYKFNKLLAPAICLRENKAEHNRTTGYRFAVIVENLFKGDLF